MCGLCHKKELGKCFLELDTAFEDTIIRRNERQNGGFLGRFGKNAFALARVAGVLRLK